MKLRNDRYYIAYGSNLNQGQMSYRCPGATPVGKITLKNHRLMFRGAPGNTHATVEPAEGYTVPVIVWKISQQNEMSLDHYEGVPRYYTKEYIPLLIDGDPHDALIYIMAKGNPTGAPSKYYYEAVRSGYIQFGLDTQILEKALEESVNDTEVYYENEFIG